MTTPALVRTVGLTALCAALATPAQALEQAPNVGLYASWVIGGEHGLSWGLVASDLMLLQGSYDCPNLSDTPVGVGPVVRLGLRGLGSPRLVVALGAGTDPMLESQTIESVHLEGGVAIPFGAGDLGFHGGATVATTLVGASVLTDPGLGETFAIGVGAQFPGFVHAPGMCYLQ